MSNLILTIVMALLASLGGIAAAPLSTPSCTNVTTVEHEYTLGGCKPIIFFYARGTTETFNMGDAYYSPGPPTSHGLKDRFGCQKIAVEGIDYAALRDTNFLPGGADPIEALAMKALLIDAATKCPRSKLLVGAYSQGAALTHRAIENLPCEVMDKIVGIALYGDTQNLQDQGRIPNFPANKTLIICTEGDVVCAGNLTITLPHIGYVSRVPEAVSFLAGKI
ncbi:related to cutinase 1 precursor [Rhynchosporium agropyri]|uniref:cutinase n=1 Tax=Rhynchosporium agropyri TaxID=914238 RepID=A0A1E1LTR5_9HELO|nr:related to cutinase 1 precursor [Rhynchosporium agropyri]